MINRLYYTLPNSIFKDRNTLNNTKQQDLKFKTYYVVIQKSKNLK